jgi:predicted phosphodiesterase
MTKKQQKIYNFFEKNKGYIKKGQNAIFNLYKNKIDNNVGVNDFITALKQARIDFKDSYANKSTKVLVDKKLVLKRLNNKEIENSAWKVVERISNFDKTPWGKKLKQFEPKVESKKNVLVIADTHEPFCKEGYLEHCIAIAKKYNCNEFVNIGDEVDLCGVSQWEKDPDGFSAGTEANLAQQKMKLWYTAFPNMKVCIGNHTARPFRQAKANGVPKKFIKSYEEAWEAPEGWKWAENWEIDNVLYTHGTGFSGANAAIKIATMHRQNTVIGHIHSEAGIQYNASKIDIIWGMQVGGALDDKSYAAYYAKDQLKKSIIGCGVVLEGKLPIYEPMKL